MNTLNDVEYGTCEYCGQPLEKQQIPAFGGKPFWIFKACSCEGAQEADRKLQEEETARKAEEERQARERRYEWAGLPRKYWSGACDDDRFDFWLHMIRSGQGLFFTGRQGRGKTYAACAIARVLIDEDKWRVKFADVEAIEREVTSSWHSRETAEENVIDRYLKADLVIIDDLGAEELTSVTMKTLRAVISGREANGGVTIFTSNYSRKDFALHIAQEADKVQAARLASRIAGMSDVVVFEGEDRRLQRER